VCFLAALAGCVCCEQRLPPDTCNFFSTVDVAGAWSTQNGCGSTRIYSLDSIELGLVANQVWILARGVPNAVDCRILDLYLMEPVDLGEGGMALAWDNFSRKKPIGRLEFISGVKMLTAWNGFYDESEDVVISDFAYDWICDDTLFNSERKDCAAMQTGLPDPQKNSGFYANKWLVITKTEMQMEKCDCGKNVVINTNHYKNLRKGYFVCIAGVFNNRSESEAFSRVLIKDKIDNYVKNAGDFVR
jgi:hypothetical protein